MFCLFKRANSDSHICSMQIRTTGLLSIGIVFFLFCSLLFAESGSIYKPCCSSEKDLALTPPMGWNSWDCFGTTVTESQVKANADYMAKHLREYGWEYIVVDIQWYEPQTLGYEYPTPPRTNMDKWGRPIPVTGKHPSAANGRGFKPLADYVHSLGLKFGIHIMRGIPKLAVKNDLPIKGSEYSAKDIADTDSTCRWNPDMYGVDMSKPGAQAYYDSLYQLFASWGVDYVKVDDIARPYHTEEIEAVHQAISSSGRPMVLSISPGPTPLEKASHVKRFTHLWRLTNDFWDNWEQLKYAFEIIDKWTPHRGPGHWPDPDMLPLGAIRQVNNDQSSWTKFTRDEQYTLMTLFCVSRAPLMFGGHLPENDDFTLSLLTNPEVLNVNQNSTNNRQLFRTDKSAAWIAEAPESDTEYLALFNIRDRKTRNKEVSPVWSSGVLKREDDVHSAEIDVDITGAEELYLMVTDAGDGYDWDHSNWAKPRIITDSGDVKLTELDWESATEGWGSTRINKSISGSDLVIDNRKYDYGIGTHSESLIKYKLPAGAKRFTAIAGLDQKAVNQSSPGCSVVFKVFTKNPFEKSPASSPVTVDLEELGFENGCKVRDLWERKDIGTFEGEFTRNIAIHGAGFYKLY